MPKLTALANRLLAPLGLELTRRTRSKAFPTAHLKPAGPPKGSVLLSYVVDPFLVAGESEISRDHTHHWESWRIAQAFLARGFEVDISDYRDDRFVPKKQYDVLVSARTQLARLAGLLPKSCVKVAHLDTAHWLTNNTAGLERLLSVRDRRGVALRNSRQVEENLAIEAADMGCVLGNDWTASTYRYAGKPIHRIPISAPATYDWALEKDFEACRHTFLWFGSTGFVHKGLDRVLEAFAGLPDSRLMVCGPIDRVPRFRDAFHKELFETPNITTVGWVDVAGDAFRDVMRGCLGLVYPSSSEGGGASAITCMHAGLIPLLTRQSSVDMPGFGVTLETGSVEEIRSAVTRLSAQPVAELQAEARKAWQFAREHHTRDGFGRAYDRFLDEVVLPELQGRRGH